MEYGYAVDCVETVRDYRFDEGKYRTYYQLFQDTSEFWNKYNPGDEMTLYLYLDGDFMDIYVDGKDLHLGTLVKVNKEFIEEYQSLIRKNKCNLSRITSWPRRADGSMDYSPSLANGINSTEETENTDNNSLTKNTKTNSEKSPLPLWAWLVIGGAVVAVGGGAVFAVKMRK